MTDTPALPADRALPLPRPDTGDGRPRRVGVELEFGGLEEGEAAQIAARTLGGTMREAGAQDYRVEGGALGDLKIYLDTRYRKEAESRLAEAGLDLSRLVVPVELVTEPIDPRQLSDLDRLRAALLGAGAHGTRDGLLYGFGLHLNPELPGTDPDRDLWPVLRAFGLLGDWLRQEAGINLSRRVLPFTGPWPAGLVDALCAGAPDDLAGTYLDHVDSRNHDLDALPVFAHLDEDRVAAALGGLGAVSARPAWHYRLPDARVGEAGWTIALEWNRWVLVERLAGDPLLDDLAADWQADDRPRDWAGHVRSRLAARPELFR